MLWHKAWLETRFRFFMGVAMTTGLTAFFVFGNPLIVRQWQMDHQLHPEWNDPAWLYRAMDDYPFFIWHFLFGYMLQQLWVLFALVLGFGGISRENAQGVAGFTLSLPVTRRRLIGTRALVGCAEIIALGILSSLTVSALSLFIGKQYPFAQGLAHSLLMVTGGLVFYCLAMFLSTVIQGEHTPTLIGVTLVAFLYFIIQPYVDGPPEPFYLKLVNVSKVMAGPPYIWTAAEVSWTGLTMSLLAAAALLYSSLKITERKDY